MAVLHPILLDRDLLHRAWPLARLAKPELTLDHWLTYARRQIGSGPLPRRGLLALSCERGYLYALVAFERLRDRKQPAVLVVDLVSQAELAHADDPLATLVDAMSNFAKLLGCDRIRVKTDKFSNFVSTAELETFGFKHHGAFLERYVDSNIVPLIPLTAGSHTMPLSTIRLELARSHEFPEGNRDRGYEFQAPLTAEGHIDVELFHREQARCKVRRFWPGEDDKVGTLHHTRHRTWAFSYAPGEEDDEAFYRLDNHVFRIGEYVTIHEPDGRDYTFRVATVRSPRN